MALKMIGVYKNKLQCMSYSKKLFEPKRNEVKPKRIEVYKVSITVVGDSSAILIAEDSPRPWSCSGVVSDQRRLSYTEVNTKYYSRGYIPATQYDMPWPKKFSPSYALSVYWELNPLAFFTAFAIALVVFHIYKAFQNKVDCVYVTHSRKNISRTMDLRHPTVHKLVLINQRYEPWPEMQKVLDLMKCAEEKQFNVIHASVCD